MNYKEDDLVLCAVTKIDKTTVFVKLDSGEEGSIIFPEIAAGRIRNIREYAFPGKKIVCKILKVNSENIELSLRRVTGKEREEFLTKYEKERNFRKMISASVKNPQEVLEKITSEYELSDFLDEIIEKPQILHNFMAKEEADKLSKIISEKKEKEKRVKKIISINSSSPSGLNDIKNVLKTDIANIYYLGSSQFLIEVTAKDFKEAEKKLASVINEIEKKAKQANCALTIKEK